jgi:hypothetical protein
MGHGVDSMVSASDNVLTLSDMSHTLLCAGHRVRTVHPGPTKQVHHLEGDAVPAQTLVQKAGLMSRNEHEGDPKGESRDLKALIQTAVHSTSQEGRQVSVCWTEHRGGEHW